MAFHVGQEVECINAARRNPRFATLVQEKQVYRIRNIYNDGTFHLVWLEGIYRRDVPDNNFWPTVFPEWADDWPLAAERFRPIQRTNKSISFTQGAPRDSEQWDNRKVRVPT